MSNNNKTIITGECYMNLPTISYYTNHYKNTNDTDLIAVVAYIYDINRDRYTIEYVRIEKGMLEQSPDQTEIIVDGKKMEV